MTARFTTALPARLDIEVEVDGDDGAGDDAMLAAYDGLGYLPGSRIETIDV